MTGTIQISANYTKRPPVDAERMFSLVDLLHLIFWETATYFHESLETLKVGKNTNLWGHLDLEVYSYCQGSD